MLPNTLFSPQLFFFVSWSSFVVHNNIHVSWLEEPQNICPSDKAHLVLPYHFHCCERKWTTLKKSEISPCWQHLYWRGSCLCFQGSAPEPLTWRSVEWGSAQRTLLKDRQAHREKKEMLQHYCISTKRSLAFITAGTGLITAWKGRHNTMAASIHEGPRTGRPCLTKKKSSSAVDSKS